MRFEKQVTINAPAAKVFEYLSDLPRHSEWSRHNLQVTPTSSGETGVGSTYNSTGEQFGQNQDTVTIKEFVPNQRVVYEADGNAGVWRHTISLQPDGQGTRVTKIIEVVKPTVSIRLMTPMIMFLAPRGMESDLGRIKEKVEAQSNGMAASETNA